MRIQTILAAAVLVLPLGAAAQSPYSPALAVAQAYQPLPVAGGGAVTTLSPSSEDDGSVAGLALPFPFAFHGTVYSAVNVGTNGYATFGAGSATSLSNQNLPSATAPNGLVALWWDDQECPAGSLKTQTLGSAPNREFVIQWHCHRYNAPANSWQAQLRLLESGSLIRVAYGDAVWVSGTVFSASAGIEDPTGLAADLPPLPGGPCGTTCAIANWPAQTLIQYGVPPQAELIPGIEVVTTTAGPGTLSATLRTTVRNIGATPAANVGWNLYQSTDAVLDAADTLLASHAAVEAVGAQSVAAFEDVISGARPAGSVWYCVEVDPTGLVAEAIEGNNKACLVDPLLVGVELTGTVSGPPLGAPGDWMPVQVLVQNRGIDPSGPFHFRLHLSADAVLDGGDLQVHEQQLDLAGGAAFSAPVDVFVPANAAGDSTFVILELDPLGEVVEIDETNQLFVSPAATDLVRPDIRATSLTVTLPDGCFFGAPATVEYELCNDGGGAARNFATAVALSDNAVITIYDPQALAVPESCISGDAAECSDLGGGAPACHLGTCHAPCATDADCGVDLLCRADPSFPGTTACQTVIEVGACVTFRRTFELPTTDEFGVPLAEAEYFFGLLADWTDAVFEDDEGNQLRRSEDSYLCRRPAMDLSAAAIAAPPVLAAGETTPVFRVVENLGIVGGTAPYRYFLSSNEHVSVDDLPLQVVGVDGDSTVELAPSALDERTELVLVPAGLAAGDYYLGLVLDPGATIDELDESNNTVVSATPVRVEASSLRVATTRLPDAIVGLPYSVHLLGAGGQGGYTFSLVAGPPPGLSLAADGLLGGVPLERGVHALQVEVRSAGSAARAVIALEIRQPAGPLAVATVLLPPAYVGVPYLVPLAASGGEPPYGWTVDGLLPSGIELRNGVLLGSARVPGEPLEFVARVTDAAGSSSAATLQLQVVEADDLRITTSRLSEAQVGQPYLACASASGGDGSYSWTVDPATAPPGLAPLAGAGCLEGTPVGCGTFAVSVSVTDGAGLTDRAELPLTVFCDAVSLRTVSLAAVHRGDSVDVTLEASAAATFRLASGKLPGGITLGTTGRLQGTVAADAAIGVHAFVVELTDSQGSLGLAALSLEVLSEAIPPQQGVEAPVASGCGCSADDSGPGPGTLSLVLLALGALLHRRRARQKPVPVPAVLAALALLAPAGALAQGSPYNLSTFPAPYQPLAAPQGLLTTASIGFNHAELALPFPVRTYGTDHSSLTVGGNGGIAWNGDDVWSANDALPDAAGTPHGVIAPFWDQWRRSASSPLPGGVFYEITGAAPNRTVKVEWQNFTNNACSAASCAAASSYSFQVWITEAQPGGGDSTIQFRYATPTPGNVTGAAAADLTGSVGLEREDGLVAVSLPCTPTCGLADWPSEQVVQIAQGPDLAVVAVSGPVIGYSGVATELTATVRNVGGRVAEGFALRFWVSADGTLSADDLEIGLAPGIASAEPSQEAAFALIAPLPAGLAIGDYHLLAEVDPFDAVAEDNEGNNVAAFGPFRIGTPAPDLAVGRLVTPASSSPGASLTVGLTVVNQGNADAAGVLVRVVLSDNEVIASSDAILAELTVDVPAGVALELPVRITLPPELGAGSYHVGVVLDPENELYELDELNNAAASATVLVIAGGPVRILTEALPAAAVGSPYCVALSATGGDGIYAWTVTAGELPGGLALLPAPGRAEVTTLCGAATGRGRFDFTLEASSGGESDARAFRLEVADALLPLSVTTRELPALGFQIASELRLGATGGVPPYHWSLAAGSLPAGLTLSPGGALTGAALVDGEYPVTVQVEDAAAGLATAAVTVRVASPGTLTCVTRALDDAAVGVGIQAHLLAAGGTRPHLFTTIESRRLADGSGQPGASFEGPPPGLQVAGNGAITGAPAFAGRYLWTVEVADAAGTVDRCALSLEVTAPGALLVTTRLLPYATPGQPYEATLTASGGSGFLTWTVAPHSQLPAGLELGADGLLGGTLDASLLGAEQRRSFDFLVEVRDAEGRRGVGALAVVLRIPEEVPPPVIAGAPLLDDGGCQAGPGAPSLLGLALAVLLLRRRKA